MENEKMSEPKAEKIDVEIFAKRILLVIETEFPNDYSGILSNLSDDGDWWDNFRYLHTVTKSLMSRSSTLQSIKSDIDEYAAKSPDDTTFN